MRGELIIILSSLVVLIILFSEGLILRRFVRRTHELNQQLAISVAKKMDTSQLILSQLMPINHGPLKDPIEQIRLLLTQGPSVLAFGPSVRLAQTLSSPLITLKNLLKMETGQGAQSILLEEVENDFRRLLLLYNNEAKALNALIKNPLFIILVIGLRLHIVEVFPL